MNDINKISRSVNHFEVALRDLDAGPIVLDRDIPLPGLTDRLKFCEYEAVPKSGRVHLEIAQMGDGVLVRGKIEASIQTQCGTCLANTLLHLKPEVSAYLLPKPAAAEELEDEELTPEDLEKEWFEGDNIVLDGLLFDSIMIEMPMNPKCGESCKGLISKALSEEKKQVDPRLAPLAKLVVEKEK